MDPADTDLQRVRELLPFHALDALGEDDRAFLLSWLARHGSAYPEMLAEIAWLQRSAAQARELAQAPAAQAGLVELMTRIAAESPPKPARVAATTTEAASTASWWSRLFASPRLGLAMAVLLLVQGVGLVLLSQRDPAQQEALSGAPAAAPAGRVLLSVAFKPDAREAELRDLLGRVGAEIVGGPSALGLWQVAVPSAAADQALAQLRAAAGLVDSVQREP